MPAHLQRLLNFLKLIVSRLKANLRWLWSSIKSLIVNARPRARDVEAQQNAIICSSGVPSDRTSASPGDMIENAHHEEVAVEEQQQNMYVSILT